VITLTSTTPPVVVQDADEQLSDLLSDLRALATTGKDGVPHASAVVTRPALLRRLAAALADGIPHGTDRIVSRAGEDAALATAVSLHTGIPRATIAAGDHGPRVEGELHRSEHIVLIQYAADREDTLTGVLAASGVTTDAVRRVFGSAQSASPSERAALFQIAGPAATEPGEKP
jgi:hypothetical protein